LTLLEALKTMASINLSVERRAATTVSDRVPIDEIVDHKPLIS